MVPNAAIRNLIREDKLHQIYSQMQVGQAGSGMQTMNQALFALYQQRLITLEQAMAHSGDADEFKRCSRAAASTPTPRTPAARSARAERRYTAARAARAARARGPVSGRSSPAAKITQEKTVRTTKPGTKEPVRSRRSATRLGANAETT